MSRCGGGRERESTPPAGNSAASPQGRSRCRRATKTRPGRARRRCRSSPWPPAHKCRGLARRTNNGLRWLSRSGSLEQAFQSWGTEWTSFSKAPLQNPWAKTGPRDVLLGAAKEPPPQPAVSRGRLAVMATTRRAAVAASGFVRPTTARRQTFGRTGRVGGVPPNLPPWQTPKKIAKRRSGSEPKRCPGRKTASCRGTRSCRC